MILLGDACVGNCFTWLLDKVRSSEPLPVGACRYCGSVISVACYECPACSCPLLHKDITRAIRVMWNKAPDGSKFGHPNRIPPIDEQLHATHQTLCKMGLHPFQRKSIRTFNGGLPYKNHFEMFAKDVNWNGIMTRAGWTADNFHMLLPMVQLALRHQSALKIKGCNDFHRRTVQIKQWWQLHAQEIF